MCVPTAQTGEQGEDIKVADLSFFYIYSSHAIWTKSLNLQPRTDRAYQVSQTHYCMQYLKKGGKKFLSLFIDCRREVMDGGGRQTLLWIPFFLLPFWSVVWTLFSSPFFFLFFFLFMGFFLLLGIWKKLKSLRSTAMHCLVLLALRMCSRWKWMNRPDCIRLSFVRFWVAW